MSDHPEIGIKFIYYYLLYTPYPLVDKALSISLIAKEKYTLLSDLDFSLTVSSFSAGTESTVPIFVQGEILVADAGPNLTESRFKVLVDDWSDLNGFIKMKQLGILPRN